MTVNQRCPMNTATAGWRWLIPSVRAAPAPSTTVGIVGGRGVQPGAVGESGVERIGEIEAGAEDDDPAGLVRRDFVGSAY